MVNTINTKGELFICIANQNIVFHNNITAYRTESETFYTVTAAAETAMEIQTFCHSISAVETEDIFDHH